MKVLKIKVTGFKLLEDDFEIDFLTKARVNNNDKEDEIVEIYDNLYMPTTTVFTGKNSSGKSTVLSLIEFVNEIIYSGRIKYRELDFRSDLINIEMLFSLEETIYKYSAIVLKPEKKLLGDANYCYFSEERLFARKYFKSHGKNIFNLDFEEVKEYISNVGDTSILYKLTSNKMLFLNSNAWFHKNSIEDIFTVFDLIDVNDNLMIKIANLFDDSIKNFSYDNESKLYLLELAGLKEKYYSESEVKTLLSDGTVKGLMIFGLVIALLKIGGSLIIDEIENSFHKNLVENIIMIFNDKRINKNKATLVFSTHYVEVIDILRRRDGIFVMTKKGDYITNCNLHEDYDDRTDLNKSNQFNNNTFDTLINYDRLMELKKELISEIPNPIRR